MSVKFFGQYLLERHLISREQLLEATKYQYQRNQKFGEYARAKGWVNDAQLAEIETKQRSEDKRFGELAVSLGFLTEPQVQEILQAQKSDYVYIGQALAQTEALSERQVEEYLADFRREQHTHDEEIVKLPLGNHDTLDEMEVVDLAKKLLWRHAGVEAKLFKADAVADDFGPSDFFVSARLNGLNEANYRFACQAPLAQKIAATVVGSAKPDDIDLRRSLTALVSAVLHTALTKFARRGKRFDLAGPTVLIGETAITATAGKPEARTFAYVAADGKLLLIID